jgi:putative phosphoesterase
MNIGIISDTHDHHSNVIKAIEIFNKRQVKYVLHAGDIVSPFTAKAFADLKEAKFIAVFGNCDGEKIHLKNAIEGFGGEVYDSVYNDQIADRRVFMTHRPDAINEVAGSGKYDLVIYGHTHRQDIRTVGKTLIVNPGEATDWLTGQPCVVVVELDDMSYEPILLV